MKSVNKVILILAGVSLLAGAAVYYYFPVAVVNGHFISRQEFEKRVFWSQSLTPKVEKKEILEGLIEGVIIADLAERQGIAVTEAELQEYYEFLINKFKSEPEKFGISKDEFKSSLVLPDLREAKLKIAILQEATASSNFKQVLLVMRKLNEGLDFALAAEVYSDDEESKYIGGDLGFLTREELPPWLGEEVFALEVGERSKIVISPEGYHILEVTARDENAEAVRVQARHILIKGQSFEEFLEKEKTKYRIYIFGKL